MLKRLLTAAALLLSLSKQSHAQDSTSNHLIGCGYSLEYLKTMGVDSPGHGATEDFIMPGFFPPAAIQTCGKFRVYYEDLQPGAPSGGTGAGFGDPTYGAARRNTMCQVLTYIQSVFDFSKVDGYIRLHVDTSWSNPGKIIPYIKGIDGLYGSNGVCAPYYNKAKATAGSLINGFVHSYMTTGMDSNLGDYHANLQMNFASMSRPKDFSRGLTGTVGPTFYTNDTSAFDPCAFDLYSNLLHLVSHSLGWFSWQDTGSFHGVSASALPHSSYDTGLCVIANPKTTANPFSTITHLLPLGSITDTFFLLNNKRPPYNSFLSRGTNASYFPYGKRYEFSHLMAYEYTKYNRITPGDLQNPVMGIPIQEGNKRRTYTKAELLTFRDAIGLALNSSFVSANATLLNNRLPWSSKMNSDAYNFLAGDLKYAEKVPADYTINNNTGTTVVINLNSDGALHDDDSDPISVFPGSLVNFRGCGDGGNNHARLTLSSSDQVITFTPRPDFYGRVQFGLNLYDGKEKGGFQIYTIEVKPGNNVGVPKGDNMVINGDFEEGAEVKTRTTGEGVNNTYYDNYLSNNPYSAGRLNNGTHLSDGHPHDDSVNYIYGTAIRDAYAECGTASAGKPFGHPFNMFPWPSDWTTTGTGDIIMGILVGSRYSDGFPESKPGATANNRYQPLGEHGILLNLTDTLKKCKRYTLEFDAFRTFNRDPASGSDTELYTPIDNVTLGFTSSNYIVGLRNSFMIRKIGPYPVAGLTRGGWKHYKVPFTYCSDTAAHILHLDIGGAKSDLETVANTLIDNISLKEEDLKMTIKIIDSVTEGCKRVLLAGPLSTGCPSLTYTWKNSSGATVGTSRELPVVPFDTTRYTVTVSDGCTTASDTINVIPCRCAPTRIFHTDAYTPISGVVSSLAPGYYHATGNLYITAPSASFTNTNILMEPDVAIFVGTTSKLILDSTHLFTCPDTNRLWAGIVLQSTGPSLGGTSGRITVRHNSLVEDANYAIEARDIKNHATDTVVNISNSTFNRNLLSVSTLGADPLGGGDSVYKFRIESTLFTSRKFDTMAGYPLTWAPTEYLRTELSTVSNTKAPYLISREYGKAYTKTGQQAYLAIEIRKMGTTLTPGSSYKEVRLGNSESSLFKNVIDNMQYGFNSLNANVTLMNTHIINIGKRMVPDDDTNHSYPTGGGMGIIAQTEGLGAYRMRIGAGGGSNTVIKLYDCYTGIFTQDMADLLIGTVTISSSHTLGDKPVPGTDRSSDWYSGEGIKLIGNRNQIQWAVSTVNISNMNSGMYLWLGNPNPGATTEITANTLNARNPDFKFSGLTGLQYILQGITVAGPGLSNWNTVKVAYNTMNEVFNGLELNNLKSAVATVEGNTINISDKTMSTIGTPQYGISALAGQGATISNNTVSTPTLSGFDYAKNIKGFYASKNTNLRFCGNFTNRIGSAFVFDGTDAQVGTRWIANTINDGWRGMTLASDIGDQGQMYDYRRFPLRTFYGPTLNKWTGFGGTKFQTITMAPTNTMLSKLYVNNLPSGTAQRPTVNISDVGLPFPYIYDYIGTTRSILVPNAPPAEANCSGGLYEYQIDPPVISGPFVSLGLGKLVISDSLSYDSTYRINQWCNQLAVYELATLHPDLRDSSAILDNFMNVAAGSRFGWLTEIEQALGTGDIGAAQQLLGGTIGAMGRVQVNNDVVITDYNEADRIVNDYMAYYQSYIRMLQGSLNASDTAIVETIANKCPPVDGAVVYKARALYQLLTGLAIQYTDDGCQDGLGGHSLFRVAPGEAISGSPEQDYTLFPNPNEGVFSIRQILPTDKIVEAKIYNALGQELHRETVQFRGGVVTFRLEHAMPGLYLVCLTDELNKVICLKFNVK